MNLIKNTWIHNLKQLHHTYDMDYFALWGYPDIKAELNKVQEFNGLDDDVAPTTQYIVLIKQVDNEGQEITVVLSQKYENIIDQSEKLLKSWKNVRKFGHNGWVFNDLETANQFLTIFGLWKKY